MDLAFLSFRYEDDPHSQDNLIKSEMRMENLSVTFMEWRQLTQPFFLIFFFITLKKNNFIEVQCTFNKNEDFKFTLEKFRKMCAPM